MIPFIRQIYKKDNTRSKKTVFIDRDGTINKDVTYLSHPSQIHILPGVIEGIRKLNAHSMLVIVVTNQPVIARGLASVEDVSIINDTLVALLQEKNAFINAIYSCPHHPERDHPDIPDFAMKYRIACECRKPKTAMFRKAIKDFDINLASAYSVGDRTADIQAGKNLGITTILVKTGFAGSDKKYPVIPDYITDNFNKAVDIIINDA